MLFYFGECENAELCTRKCNSEVLILLCQQQSFGLMFMFIWKCGCAMTSFFQSPHLSGQNSPLLSLNNLLKDKPNPFAVSRSVRL